MNQRQKIVQQQFLNNEAEIIKRLDQTYSQALKDIDKKIERLMKRFDPETGDLPQSAIYQIKYQKMLRQQVEGILNQLHTQQYVSVSDYLDECYTDGFIGTIFDLHGQDVPLMMPIDQQAMVRAVQLDSKISQGLYTRLGEDVSVLKKKITSEVSRSIATGMTYAQTAQQLARQSRIGFNRAVRIARTEGHRIQNTATMDAMYAAKDKGAEVVKQWDATLDSVTRESHVMVDMEIRELDERFSNGLMFPGDPSGSAAEVVNCRCCLDQRARWALEGSFTKFDGFSGEIKEFEDLEAYNQFKEAYFSKENRSYMDYMKDLEDRYQTKDFNKILNQMTDSEYKHFAKLQDARPQFPGMYRGDDVIKKKLEIYGNSDIIKSEDIIIYRSVGAKAKNYDIELPNKDIVHLTEGTRITHIETIAGKGRMRQIDEISELVSRWGGSEFEWQKKKGIGYVDYDGESFCAELHWYEEPTAGKHKWKVKPDADGNWFIED